MKLDLIGIHPYELDVTAGMFFLRPADEFIAEIDPGLFRTFNIRQKVTIPAANFKHGGIFMRKIVAILCDLIPIVFAEKPLLTLLRDAIKIGLQIIFGNTLHLKSCKNTQLNNSFIFAGIYLQQ